MWVLIICIPSLQWQARLECKSLDCWTRIRRNSLCKNEDYIIVGWYETVYGRRIAALILSVCSPAAGAASLTACTGLRRLLMRCWTHVELQEWQKISAKHTRTMQQPCNRHPHYSRADRACYIIHAYGWPHRLEEVNIQGCPDSYQCTLLYREVCTLALLCAVRCVSYLGQLRGNYRFLPFQIWYDEDRFSVHYWISCWRYKLFIKCNRSN
jgi:hypothetical protein